MKIDEFNYTLPKSLIAQYPLPKRDESLLMVVNRKKGTIEHRKFKQIIEYLNPGDLLVVNNSKVLPARLLGKTDKGEKVELLVIPKKGNTSQEFEVLIKNSKKIKERTRVHIGDNMYVEIKDVNHGRGKVLFSSSEDVLDILEKFGHIPLPPYIKREDEALDKTSYQTVFAERNGSIAAPTAGLHFSEELINEIKCNGIRVAKITLHVGIATFAPIKSENIEEHEMEAEWAEITQEVATVINETKQKGGRVISVGTTTTRALESFLDENGKVTPKREFTSIFIYPPFNFRVIDGLVTNFHLPKSTPLLLVSAFAGKDLIFEAYKKAIEKGYRFYSYGDAMLIL